MRHPCNLDMVMWNKDSNFVNYGGKDNYGR